MREVKSVTVTTAKPTGPGDPGQCEIGFYFLENDWLTLCDEGGTALRDENTGQRITQRLERCDNEQTIAKKMTLRRYREAHRGELAGFQRRPIRYRDLGY